jgi:hypothetical protein
VCSYAHYCSTECQKADWKVGSSGAGHKTWCKVKPGVEGIHWEIRDISVEKGKGIVALVPFKQDERILVDRLFSEEEFFDPSFRLKSKALLLAGGPSLKEKYVTNCIGSADDRGVFGGVCISLSRANHECSPSAVTYYDIETRSMVLHAAKPIKPGDEITISYPDFLDPRCTGEKTKYAIHSGILRQQYGIICPDGCACKDSSQLARVQESNRLEKEFQDAMTSVQTTEEADKAIADKGLKWAVYHNTYPARVRFGVRLTLYNTARAFGMDLKGLQIYELACALTYPGSRAAENYRGI